MALIVTMKRISNRQNERTKSFVYFTTSATDIFTVSFKESFSSEKRTDLALSIKKVKNVLYLPKKRNLLKNIYIHLKQKLWLTL